MDEWIRARIGGEMNVRVYRWMVIHGCERDHGSKGQQRNEQMDSEEVEGKKKLQT